VRGNWRGPLGKNNMLRHIALAALAAAMLGGNAMAQMPAPHGNSLTWLVSSRVDTIRDGKTTTSERRFKPLPAPK
jgi:hypothetical protein